MAFPQRLSARQLDARIEALSYRGGPTPEGMVFAYAFESRADPDSPLGGAVSGYRGWGPADKAAARDAMDAFAEVIDVSFRPARKGQAPDLQFFRADDLGGSAGWGSFRYADAAWRGFVTLQSGSSDDPALLLHELGHALGLKHPGAYGGAPGPFLAAREDTPALTVMSYAQGRHEPATPMVYDIAALQDRWGENAQAHAGRTRWTAPEASQSAAIWDAGGRDRIVHRGPAEAKIDLREGAFSSLGEPRNLSIAYGVAIEDARGGGGDDRLIGNAARNTLAGGGGEDMLRGGGRGDRLVGGRGDDRLDGQGGDDRLKGGPGVDEFRYARGGGSDVIVDFAQGETLRLARVEGFRQLEITDADGDAQIRAKGVDLLLKEVAADALDPGDFAFV